MLAKVEAIANRPLAPLSPCADEMLLRCLRWIAAMPRKADDDLTGKARVALYQRHLSGYPEAAILHLADVATGRGGFMPDVGECKAILAQWSRNDLPAEIQRSASWRARIEHTTRYDEAMAALKARRLDQAAIDALPHRTRQHAAEVHGYLWAWPDGTHTARPDPSLMHEEELTAHRANVRRWSQAWDDHRKAALA